MPTITALQAISKEKYDIDAYFSNDYKQNEINRAYRVVVDHLKAVLFALADGAVISNKERGSVLRRLIRRALLTAKKLKPNANFVRVVISKLIETMQEFYPQLSQHKEHILHVCEAEQEQFKNTIEKNLEYFNKIISQNKNLDADTVFKLVETYGFPIEIIKEKAAEQGVSFDESGFKQKMEAHKKTSRANLEIKGMSVQATGLINFTTKSTFIYDQYELSDAKIIGLFDDKFNPVEKINNDG
jgi:alanyl-tRNA synthetase